MKIPKKKFSKVFSNAWIKSILCSIIATIIVSAITATIIVSAITAFITALYKEINILQAINLLIQTILTCIKTILTLKIPVYFILITIALLIIIFNVLKMLYGKKSNLPKYLNYKYTQYKNWYFAWEYELRYDNKYCVVNVHPICRCGCELTYKDEIHTNNNRGINSFLTCPKCGCTYPIVSDIILEDFQKVLIYDINNNIYPKV